LICGLGNQDLIEDSLGPLAVKKIPAHIMEVMEVPSQFSAVALMTPGVLWHTNLKTETALSGIIKEIGAACVIIIDSTRTDSFENLASTIQITNGHDKGNGQIFSQKSLSIPIVGIGVPLVMRYTPVTDTGSSETLMRTGIADDLESAAVAIAYGISHVAYPKVIRKELREIIRQYDIYPNACLFLIKIFHFRPEIFR